MRLHFARLVLWGLVAEAALVFALMNLGWMPPPQAVPPSRSGITNDALPVGGEFSLVDPNGQQRTWGEFRGRPVAMFFGFTHCPDICPTTLSDLSGVLADLKDRGDAVQVIFVTGDPKRDTPEVLRDYLQSFDPRIVGLTGSESEINQAFKVFRAFRAIVPLEKGDYTVNHSASVFLYDQAGRFAGTLDPEEPVKIRLDKMIRLVDRKAG